MRARLFGVQQVGIANKFASHVTNQNIPLGMISVVFFDRRHNVLIETKQHHQKPSGLPPTTENRKFDSRGRQVKESTEFGHFCDGSTLIITMLRATRK
jgi:hypothetical protein